MSSFSEKTGDDLLGSVSCATNFCWIWLILKKHTADCCLLSGSYAQIHDSSPVVFRNTAIAFLEHLFRPIYTNRFLSDWQIVCDPMWTNFFWQPNVHKILNVFWSHESLRLSQSHDRSHDNIGISVSAQHQWFCWFGSSWNTHTFDCCLLSGFGKFTTHYL